MFLSGFGKELNVEKEETMEMILKEFNLDYKAFLSWNKRMEKNLWIKLWERRWKVEFLVFLLTCMKTRYFGAEKIYQS